MPRRIQLAPHLSLAELAARHNTARDVVTREQWRVLYWLG